MSGCRPGASVEPTEARSTRWSRAFVRNARNSSRCLARRKRGTTSNWPTMARSKAGRSRRCGREKAALRQGAADLGGGRGRQRGDHPRARVGSSRGAAGDKKTVSITFPAEFPAGPGAGRKDGPVCPRNPGGARAILPRARCRLLQGPPGDDLEGLKDQVRTNLKRKRSSGTRWPSAAQVTQALAERVQFEPPASLVEAETAAVLRQFIAENMRRGVPPEQFEKDKKELFEGARQGGERRVKLAAHPGQDRRGREDRGERPGLRPLIRRRGRPDQPEAGEGRQGAVQGPKCLTSVQQAIIFDKAVDFLVLKAKFTRI